MKKINHKLLLSALMAGALVIAFGLSFHAIFSVKAASAVNLGTASNFAVLAGSAITDTTPSVVSGDVGLSPTTGAAIGIPSSEVTGTIYAVDAAGPSGSVSDAGLLTLAKNSLTAAFSSAGQTTTGVIAADLGGQTLLPGVYQDNSAPNSLAINGTLTLDGNGDPNAVFIFKSGSTLVTGSASHVALIKGAQACNVFWQVGSSATLGTNSFFVGTILADQSITDNGGTTIDGRLLASIGAVTLNNTHLTRSTCVSAPAATPPTGASPTPTLVPPLISVSKVPTPLSLPVGPGSVTYNYAVANIGTVAMSPVTIADNSCPAVSFISGDSNGDAKLDTSEIWMYRCVTTLSQTTTNTVTVTGQANGFTATDTANATVVVALPIVPPLIHIVKRPNLFFLPVGGGAVTYMYTITNPGTAPLNNVSVIDNKCTGLPGRVVGHPGDLNKNDLLESNEAWSFVCQTNINQTTTNTATAEGSANGLTALDFSLATVAVPLPNLPNSGTPPGGISVWWILALVVGMGIAVATSWAIVSRSKRTR